MQKSKLSLSRATNTLVSFPLFLFLLQLKTNFSTAFSKKSARNPIYNILILLLLFSFNSIKAQVSITATVGTAGPTAYTTLKSAFDAVNSGTHKGVITIAITGNTTETAVASLNASGAGSASYTSLAISPSGGAARTISGSLVGGAIIYLNGADNVTINGLNTGSNSLTISNTSTASNSGTATIRFINDATNNIVTNCTISGSETANNSGTVFFSTGTTTGNDSNTISYCTVTGAGGNLPINAIYSAGTSGAENSEISITNNNIQDYFSATAASNGIYLASNSTAWTITNNKFFQTATRTATSNGVTHRAINIITANGGGYDISNNTIGFANSTGTGITTYTGTTTNSFRGIELTSGSSVSSIQANTISGISFTTANNSNVNVGIFGGISVLSGAVNIGTTTGNTIGSGTTTGAITVLSTATPILPRISGIYVASAGMTSAVQNNIIGGITTSGGATTTGYSIFGIITTGSAANFTTSNNTIGSSSAANSIVSGTSGATTAICAITGILNEATGTQSITNNSILNCRVNGTAASTFIGIYNNNSSPVENGLAVSINANTIDTNTLSGVLGITGTVNMRGIFNKATTTSIAINSNILKNFTLSTATPNFTAIENNGAVLGSIIINGNQLGNATYGLLTYSVANSGAMSGIVNSAGDAAATLSIQSNDIQGITHTAAGSSAHNYIVSSAATFSQTIKSNTFTSLSVNTTGNVIFISNKVALAASGIQDVSSNSIGTSFSKTGDGNTVTLYITNATSASGSTMTNSLNDFSNITVAGATNIIGWSQQDLGTATKTISYNTFSNWTAGTGSITVMQLAGFGNTSAINNNTISGIANQGAINGINIVSTGGTAAILNVANNSISGLTSTGAAGSINGLLCSNNSTVININNSLIKALSSTTNSGNVNGIQISGGTGTDNIFKNKIFDISVSGTGTNSGIVNGILLAAGTTVNVYTNLVGDLRTPNCSSGHAIRGISVNPSVPTINTSFNLYYNSIYLNASSTGSNFGTDALFHKTNLSSVTAKLLMKNNIIVNTSTPSGTGKTAAYYRSDATLANYDTASNKNLLYAGTPSTTNYIYFDGVTNFCQTLTAFQSKVKPREINDVTENVVFLSTDGTTSDFLRPTTAGVTYIESSGVNISGITSDFEGSVIQGNAAYTGSGTAPDLGAFEIGATAPVNPVVVSDALIGNGTYATLASAIIAINSGSQLGADISIQINNDLTEGSSGITLNEGTWNSLLIRPNGDRTINAATTSGNAFINLNGADKVTIDGYNVPGNSLTISNTTVSSSAGTSTIQFVGDATNNIISNCTILGSPTVAATTNGGVISFGLGTTTGNDNNLISNCMIGPAGVNLPSKLISSIGLTASADEANSSNTIDSCSLYDYFLTTNSAAVYAGSGNTDWNVTNNKIYQTATRTFTTTGSMYGIYFSNATYGDNIQITGNTIGFANNLGTGTFNLTGSSIPGSFYGIYFQAMPTAAVTCNLNNNTVSDVSLNSSTGSFYGIYNLTGATSNTININTNTVKNISLLSSTATAYGINWSGASTINVNDNTVNSISRDTAGAIYGISSTGASVTETVSNNTVNNLACNSAAAGNIYGIFQSTSTSGTKTFQNNIINTLTGTGGSNIYGLTVSNGSAIDISRNTINGLASTGGTNPTIAGIRKLSVSAGNIYKNKIYDLSSSTTSPTLYGIFTSGAGSTANIYNNKIGDLRAPLANASNPINGIYINQGTTANLYYNTVLLSGSSSGALFGSSAIFANTATNVTLRNNIFVNNSTTSGAGLAAAYRRINSTLSSYDAASNNNLFYGSTIYTDGTNTDATLAAYKSRVASRDAASVSANPVFISTAGSNAQFLHVDSTVANVIESTGTAISGYTDDFDGDLRNATTPDIGADEFDSTPTISGFSPTTLCDSGGNEVTINGTNLSHSSSTVKFNGVLGTITAQTATSITVTSPASLTSGTIIVTNSSGTATSATSYTVNPANVGGTVAANQSIYAGTAPADLTLSGNTGAVTKWQKSTDAAFTSPIDIANTSTTLSGASIGILTTTTYFRAVVQSGVCSPANSSYVTITVSAARLWTGSVSTSWSNPDNWDGPVPTIYSDVTIPLVANQPQISADAFAKSLTLANGTTLKVMSGYNLKVTDVIANSGTLTVQNNANLIQTNNVSNSGSGTTIIERNTAALMRLDYILWSSPVDGQKLLSFSPETLTARFYTYDSSNDLYSSVAAPSTTNFSLGTAYLIRLPNTHPTTGTIWNGTFSGTSAHNGTYNLSVTPNTFNAIGNPYPSTINADTFITSNSISGALYFWRKTNNSNNSSYATYTLAGGIANGNSGDPLGLEPNGFIQVGQGFITKSTSSTISFTNAMRVGNNDNQFLRTRAIERNRIWLNLNDTNGMASQTMVAYMTNATQGIDDAIDGRYFNDSQTALTSIINNEEFAIQGRALPFDPSDDVPLGFKSQLAGNYTISLDHFDGLFSLGQDVYLKDNLLNTKHNLRTSGYSFTTEAGVFNSRFEIVYQNTLAVKSTDFNINSVIAYKQGQELVINSGNITMNKVQVFDTRGRLLVDKKQINSSETRINTGTTTEVLFVKITSESNGTVTKKVIN